MPQAEEVFDLIFYRPLAFMFVKGIYRLPITPNQVTLLSLIAGFAAAWFFSTGNPALLVPGAIWYAAANILDCADGQLARLQNSGTLLGRVVDGVADYFSSIAIFLGIGFGLAASGGSAWVLVVVAGISSAIHAMVFDKEQSEFLSASRGIGNFLDREIGQFTAEVRRLKSERRMGMRTVALSLYLRYLNIQRRAGAEGDDRAPDAPTGPGNNIRMIRLWSFLGPTTNRTLLIVCALIGRIDLYLWIIVVAGNLWLAVCSIVQGRIHRKTELRQSAALASPDPRENVRKA